MKILETSPRLVVRQVWRDEDATELLALGQSLRAHPIDFFAPDEHQSKRKAMQDRYLALVERFAAACGCELDAVSVDDDVEVLPGLKRRELLGPPNA